jgi:PKD repeat protein
VGEWMSIGKRVLSCQVRGSDVKFDGKCIRMSLKMGLGVFFRPTGMGAILLILILLMIMPGAATITPDFVITDQAGFSYQDDSSNIIFPINDSIILSDISTSDENILLRNWTVKDVSDNIIVNTNATSVVIPSVLSPGEYDFTLDMFSEQTGYHQNIISGSFLLTDPGTINADFTYASGMDSIPYNISLIDQSQDFTPANITNWYWRVNNSAEYQVTSPKFTVTPGNFVVNMTIIDDQGNMDTISKIISVPPLTASPAQAFFTYGIVNDGTNRTVQFTDKSLNYPLNWHWNFGDGSSSFEQNPQHQYSLFNTTGYLVSLVASNGGGTSKISQTILLPAPVTWPSVIKADFSVNQTEPGIRTFAFTNASVGFLSGTFDFDDGNTSSIDSGWSSFPYTFYESGNHMVTLTVTNGTSSATKSKWVYVT